MAKPSNMAKPNVQAEKKPRAASEYELQRAVNESDSTREVIAGALSSPAAVWKHAVANNVTGSLVCVCVRGRRTAAEVKSIKLT